MEENLHKKSEEYFVKDLLSAVGGAESGNIKAATSLSASITKEITSDETIVQDPIPVNLGQGSKEILNKNK